MSGDYYLGPEFLFRQEEVGEPPEPDPEEVRLRRVLGELENAHAALNRLVIPAELVNELIETDPDA